MRPTQLIAPCGINCGICSAHLRERNPCPGCRGSDAGKPVTRLKCKMKTCGKSHNGRTKFCFQCHELPCESLEHLDKRYRTKYHMSPIENLRDIKEGGVSRFVEKERARWRCATCGGTVCGHTGLCAECGETKDF
ncbi:DUF3795 domain-containing protein [bacterium]|nr:MAG: DUF3795 domain-containing protein [bacterium]